MLLISPVLCVLFLNFAAHHPYIRAVERDFDLHTGLEALICEARAMFGLYEVIDHDWSLKWLSLSLRLCSLARPAFLRATSSRSTVRHLNLDTHSTHESSPIIDYVVPLCTSPADTVIVRSNAKTSYSVCRAVLPFTWKLLFNVFQRLVISTRKQNFCSQSRSRRSQ